MISREEMDKIMQPEQFTGRSQEQVTEFLQEFVQPVLDANQDILNETAELSV